MKKSITSTLALAAALSFAGCASQTHDKGPYLPQNSITPAYESTEPVVLMDPGVRYSVTTTGQPIARLIDDGRMEVGVSLRNRENRRIEVQGQCVFKDVGGISTGDETPWQTVILTENSTEQIKFVSSNDKAKRFTIRVRQAR
jgi:predicted small lipoprotein YifL